MQRCLIFIFCILAFNSFANTIEYQQVDLKMFLTELYRNPQKVMNQIPPKQNARNFFKEEDIKNKNFIYQKDIIRKKLIGDQEPPQEKAIFQDNDLAEKIVDNGIEHIRNLDDIDSLNIDQAKLEKHPWSDDYWPIKSGILGKRYADPDVPKTLFFYSWKEFHNYVEEHPVGEYIENYKVDLLSPSEKYDLLVGDKNYILTREMWKQGESYYNFDGEVQSWMGICHGWAAASYMLERPVHKVEVLSTYDEIPIMFYPSDIKALASLLWAKAPYRSKYAGSRCNVKGPEKDPKNGRIIDQNCFDTNPGTWHKVIINQIAINKRSFIMDATYDYQVWNQPIFSYHYSYFNPITSRMYKDWQQARIRVEDFHNDPFKKYRNNASSWIVGVQMRVTYMAETSPRHQDKDTEKADGVTTVTYRYDLELDENGTIIGGEWYSNAHPDFLWTPKHGQKLMTYGDHMIRGRWEKGKKLPDSWRKAALKTSDTRMPLAAIVDGLIERSQKAPVVYESVPFTYLEFKRRFYGQIGFEGKPGSELRKFENKQLKHFVEVLKKMHPRLRDFYIRNYPKIRLHDATGLFWQEAKVGWRTSGEILLQYDFSDEELNSKQEIASAIKEKINEDFNLKYRMKKHVYHWYRWYDY